MGRVSVKCCKTKRVVIPTTKQMKGKFHNDVMKEETGKLEVTKRPAVFSSLCYQLIFGKGFLFQSHSVLAKEK